MLQMEFQTQQIQNNVSAYILSRDNVSTDKNIFVLGEKIRNARKKKGFTLKELGARINLTHSALSLIENNKNDAARKTLIALAKELNDNFGEFWLNEYLVENTSAPSKKELIEDMTVREFVSLKFGGKQTRKSRKELEMLTHLLDAEIERIKND